MKNMLEKILIAEDHESSNISVRKALEDIGLDKNDYVYYCDDALLRVKHAIKNKEPYDLLITDLSFEDDHTPQKLSSGTELIKAVKELQPGIKVLVFSVENRPSIIDHLFKDLAIDAFVRKARRDVTELKAAIQAIKARKRYISIGLRQSIRDGNTYEFKDYDIVLITLLSKGILQKDIPKFLAENNIKPAGLSSVEKRLNRIRETLSFTKNEQLIVFCKDLGVI